MTFANLKKLVAELEQVEKRANKYRQKRGEITIAADEYNRMAQALGLTITDDVDSVTLPIGEYVKILDDYIAAVCNVVIAGEI